MQKIQIDTKQMLLPTKTSNDNVVEAGGSLGEKEASRPKLLCGIYTYDKNHPRIEAVVNAWGWKCDGFFAASTLTDPSIGAINLPHYGEEAYNNMWQKTRSIWAYIYDNYMNDYDYFWLGGDDYYLIVENLLKFLGTIDSSNGEARLIGHQIPKGGSNFCGGGPGYVLNRMAVKRFVEEALPKCAVSCCVVFSLYIVLHSLIMIYLMSIIIFCCLMFLLIHHHMSEYYNCLS